MKPDKSAPAGRTGDALLNTGTTSATPTATTTSGVINKKRRSHFRLFLAQNYAQLFGHWGGYGYGVGIFGLGASIVFSVLLTVLHNQIQGSRLKTDETLYSFFGPPDGYSGVYHEDAVEGYKAWHDCLNPLSLFVLHLVITIFGFALYLGVVWNFIAAMYFHVFEERFTQMADVVQIYGVSPRAYWGTKFLANWSLLLPLAVVMWWLQSLVPSQNVGFRDLVFASGFSTGVGLSVFNLLSMAVFPLVAGACLAGYLGLKYGNSAGQAEGIKATLTSGNLLLFMLFGAVELFVGSQPISLISLAVDFTFNRDADASRTCFGRDATTGEPNGPADAGYGGAVINFGLGVFFPGYAATKMWTDQSMNAAVIRAAHARAIGSESGGLALGSPAPPPDGRAVFWCAWNGTLRPPTELEYGHDLDVAKTYAFVKHASANSNVGGFRWWFPAALDHAAAVLNVVLWVVLFWRAAAPPKLKKTSKVDVEDFEQEVAAGGAAGRADVLGRQGQHRAGARTKDEPADVDEKKQLALEVRNLSKAYDGKKFVNTDVSFDVQKGQIFALLGHNGAGKTTLMRQITALSPPTAGDAFVNGKSVSTEPGEVRKCLAFCPQQNPMWKGYTLREHLEFFVELRVDDERMSPEEAERRLLDYTRKLGLEEKLDTKCERLSGGQKRRMWTLCALLQSRDSLILLDEPTSGLDPQARRDFWLLLDEVCRQENRGCVFSTHYLEEADMLAEEKVILAGGKVVASGTSAQMKDEFGAGFWVTLQLDEHEVAKDEDSTTETRADLLFAAARDLLLCKFLGEPLQLGREFLEQRYTKSDAPGRVLQCLVPFDHAGKLPDMLRAFEDESVLTKYKLDCRVTVEKTTLEEVFQKVGEEGDPEEIATARTVSRMSDHMKAQRQSSVSERLDEHTAASKEQKEAQVLALLKKKASKNTSTAFEGAAAHDDKSNPGRAFCFCRQVGAVFRFRLQSELFSVLLPCLLTTAILWVFCWRTPNTSNVIFVASGDLACDFFLFLGMIGAGQFALAGRLREERDMGRLAHLMIHGVSRTAYLLGTVLFYLLPALFVMLAGFAAAEQAIAPPWNVATLGMSNTLWVVALVYAMDVILFGVLLSEAPGAAQTVFLVLSLVVPILIFRNYPDSGPKPDGLEEHPMQEDERLTELTMLEQFGLYPRNVPLVFQMFVPKSWIVLARGVFPILLPNAAAASVYAHSVRMRNLVVYLQTYYAERQKGVLWKEIDLGRMVARRRGRGGENGGSEAGGPDDVEEARQLAKKYLDDLVKGKKDENLDQVEQWPEGWDKDRVKKEAEALDLDDAFDKVVAEAEESEGQQEQGEDAHGKKKKSKLTVKLPLPPDVRAGVEALQVLSEPNKRGTQDRVTEALNHQDEEDENLLQKHGKTSADVALFWGGRLPHHLAELLDELTPVEEVIKIQKKSVGRLEGLWENREAKLIGAIRHPSWKSGTDVVQTWHWSVWAAFLGGFGLRLLLWALLLICRTAGKKAGGAKTSAVAQDEVVDTSEDVGEREKQRLLANKREVRGRSVAADVEAGDGRDADVVAEEARVLLGGNHPGGGLHEQADDLTAKRITKCFKDANGKEKWALNGVTFGVQRGECFGLLGPNGAGKSTMFTMLSGNYADTGPPTGGDITVLGEDVLRSGFSKAYTKMGIVPQFDHHLFPYANAQQHMELYLVVNGEQQEGGSTVKQAFIEEVLRDVGLDPKNPRPVGEYSGGMMRRLSFAITLVTNPEILLLDELSAGVDIVSQRLLWKKMQNRPKGQTIITTSHSMTEVEAVCSRVCIMVGGELQCFGTTSRIKQVHGGMCQLDLYCCFRAGAAADNGKAQDGGEALTLQDKVDRVSESIASALYNDKGKRGKKLFALEQHAFSNARFRVVFGVDRANLELAKLFAWCQADPLACVDDFMIGEPTIEQIFLKFAAKQEALDEAETQAE